MHSDWLSITSHFAKYNHPTRGDYRYNNEALIFNVATLQLSVDVFEEEINKRKKM